LAEEILQAASRRDASGFCAAVFVSWQSAESMIIGYFNISRALFSPAEANAVLIVDADAVLSVIFSALRPGMRFTAQGSRGAAWQQLWFTSGRTNQNAGGGFDDHLLMI
jgi:hypothetical protein